MFFLVEGTRLNECVIEYQEKRDQLRTWLRNTPNLGTWYHLLPRDLGNVIWEYLECLLATSTMCPWQMKFGFWVFYVEWRSHAYTSCRHNTNEFIQNHD